MATSSWRHALQAQDQPQIVFTLLQRGVGGEAGSFGKEALIHGDNPRHLEDGPLGQARSAFWERDISGRRGQPLDWR